MQEGGELLWPSCSLTATPSAHAGVHRPFRTADGLTIDRSRCGPCDRSAPLRQEAISANGAIRVETTAIVRSFCQSSRAAIDTRMLIWPRDLIQLQNERALFVSRILPQQGSIAAPRAVAMSDRGWLFAREQCSDAAQQPYSMSRDKEGRKLTTGVHSKRGI